MLDQRKSEIWKALGIGPQWIERDELAKAAEEAVKTKAQAAAVSPNSQPLSLLLLLLLIVHLKLLRPPQNLSPVLLQRRPLASRRVFPTATLLRPEVHDLSRLRNLLIAVPARPAEFDRKPIPKRVFTRSQQQIGRP